MRSSGRSVGAALIGLVLVQMAGCPTSTSTSEFVTGSTGAASTLRSQASVTVLTPVSNLSITGGTQVEVNWQAFARTPTSVINVIIDQDSDPNNGNEIKAFSNLPLTQTNALVDTTSLAHGTYQIGVLVIETGAIVAFAYAPGNITIDQRPVLFFDPASPGQFGARDNVSFDRDAVDQSAFQRPLGTQRPGLLRHGGHLSRSGWDGERQRGVSVPQRLADRRQLFVRPPDEHVCGGHVPPARDRLRRAELVPVLCSGQHQASVAPGGLR